jgi:hypothetical protein
MLQPAVESTNWSIQRSPTGYFLHALWRSVQPTYILQSLFFLGTRMGLASQCGWHTSLMKLASNNLTISLCITSFLSSVKQWSLYLTSLAFGSRCNSSSINSPRTPGMLASFHAKMSLFSLRSLTSMSSHLGSKFLPTWATLEGSSVDNGIILLRVSYGWMEVLEVLASGMTRSEGGGNWRRPASNLWAL